MYFIDGDFSRGVSLFAESDCRFDPSTALLNFRPFNDSQPGITVNLTQPFQFYRPLRPFKNSWQLNIRLPLVIMLHWLPFLYPLVQLYQVFKIILICVAPSNAIWPRPPTQIVAHFKFQLIHYLSDTIYVLTGLVTPTVFYPQRLFFIIGPHTSVVKNRR